LQGFSAITLRENARSYFHLFVQFFTSAPTQQWVYLYYLLVAFFLVGVWTRRNADQMPIIFFAAYFAVMVIWPEWQGIRFIFPLIPCSSTLPFRACWLRSGHCPGVSTPRQGVIYLFWLVLAGLFLFHSGTRAYTNLKDGRRINGPFDPFTSDMYNFVRAETPPDSVFVFFKPRAFRLFTDRDAIMSLECDRLLLGDYVALHRNWEYSQILPDQIGECNLPLVTVYENRRFIVYELQK
jgi:hypothetical protein